MAYSPQGLKGGCLIQLLKDRRSVPRVKRVFDVTSEHAPRRVLSDRGAEIKYSGLGSTWCHCKLGRTQCLPCSLFDGLDCIHLIAIGLVPPPDFFSPIRMDASSAVFALPSSSPFRMASVSAEMPSMHSSSCATARITSPATRASRCGSILQGLLR